MNPDNVKDVGGFFPAEVADRVPHMIKILCVCWLGLAIVGIIMIFPYKAEEKIAENNVDAKLLQQESPQTNPDEIEVQESGLSKTPKCKYPLMIMINA